MTNGGEHVDPESPEQIRNVVLVGPAGSGKTALFERLVAARTQARVSRGEPAQSTSLTAATVPSGSCVINLLDTPGNPDFVGEVRAGLRAADAVLFVVPATDEIDDATKLLWRECEATAKPRAVAVTKLEQARADFAETVARCRRSFGDAQPLEVPLLVDGRLTGCASLLGRDVVDFTSGEPIDREPTADEGSMIEELRGSADGVDHRGVGGRGPAGAASER